MPRIDDILASVIKGAHEAGASVEQLSVGREEKLAGLGGGAFAGNIAGAHYGQNAARPKEANMAGFGGATGSLGAYIAANAANIPHYYGGLPNAALLGGTVGAGIGADEGKGWDAASGALGGGLLGGVAGNIAGGLATKYLRAPVDASSIGSLLGTVGGSTLGGHFRGKEEGLLDRIRGKFSSAEDAYLAGSAEASARYKVAFLPLAGALLGPTLGRMAAGRIAGGALGRMGGGAVGRTAGRIAGSTGLRGGAVDMGLSMAGQQAGQLASS